MPFDSSWNTCFEPHQDLVGFSAHWTHLEHLRYFGSDRVPDERCAPEICRIASEQIGTDDYRVHCLLSRMHVSVVCTIDHPCDDLKPHQKMAGSDVRTRVFRPDRATEFRDIGAWNEWRQRLAEVSGRPTEIFSGFVQALESRHIFFHKHGCRLLDRDLKMCPAVVADPGVLEDWFNKAVEGRTLERGLLFDDFALLSRYVRGICFENVRDLSSFSDL